MGSQIRKTSVQDRDFWGDSSVRRARVRGVLPDYCQVAVSLTYYSGMRMGEVFSLDWKQVNLIEGKLTLSHAFDLCGGYWYKVCLLF